MQIRFDFIHLWQLGKDRSHLMCLDRQVAQPLKEAMTSSVSRENFPSSVSESLGIQEDFDTQAYND
jgi:hypothetical protein